MRFTHRIQAIKFNLVYCVAARTESLQHNSWDLLCYDIIAST